MSFAQTELNEVDWIPVPDEGWTVEAATPGNPQVLFLNGEWEFAVRPRDAQEGWLSTTTGHRWGWDNAKQRLCPDHHWTASEFERTFHQADCPGPWTSISVPDHWEIHAHSQAVFAHQSLPKDDVVGYYRRTFAIPQAWLDSGRIILQAEGIAASSEVYVNNRRVGYHDGGFVPFQLDVTDALGVNNRMAIRVRKVDISTVHDNSGQWMLSGIWRDLFLFHVPQAHVRNLEVDADYDPGSRTGNCAIHLRFAAPSGGSATASLYDSEDTTKPVVNRQARWAAGNDAISLDLSLAAALPWSPENPRLYRLEVVLNPDQGEQEIVREEVGFRRFSCRDEQFLLNGRPYLVRGVTRHEIKQGRGRVLSVADMEHEIRLMREANVTGVRSHPYPFDPRWIKLCARHGILVCSEFCLCGYNSWGNPWTPSEVPTYPKHEADIDPGYRQLFQERYAYFAPRIYGRLKNATAIAIWSLANESTISEIFVPVARFLGNRERERLIISAGDANQCGSQFESHPEQRALIDEVRFGHLTADAHHYPETEASGKAMARLPWFPQAPRPMFYTEAAHVFCNRDNLALDPGMLGDLYGKALGRFFSAVRQTPAVGGYFVFEWSDQSVMQKGDPALCDSFIKPWHGYVSFSQNLKGLVGSNHEPKPAYHALRKVYAQVEFLDCEVSAGAIHVGLHNDYTFRDLADLRFCLVFADDRNVVVAPPVPFNVTCPPGEDVRVSVPATVPADVGMIRCEVYDPAWPGALAEREWQVKPRTFAPVDIAMQPSWPVESASGLAGLTTDHLEQSFVSPATLSLGLLGSLGEQGYLGMGHLQVGALPENVLVAPAARDHAIKLAPGRREETFDFGPQQGQVVGTMTWTQQDDAVLLSIGLERRGAPAWLTGGGAVFTLPPAYGTLAWRRRSGLWNEYPPDHPDRLQGMIALDRDEWPPINPYRRPAWSAAAAIRNADTVVLTGNGVPPLRIQACSPNQRVVVRTRPDHAREVLLLADELVFLPYHEFSFLRGDADACMEFFDIHQLTADAPVQSAWRLSLASPADQEHPTIAPTQPRKDSCA